MSAPYKKDNQDGEAFNKESGKLLIETNLLTFQTQPSKTFILKTASF